MDDTTSFLGGKKPANISKTNMGLVAEEPSAHTPRWAAGLRFARLGYTRKVPLFMSARRSTPGLSAK